MHKNTKIAKNKGMKKITIKKNDSIKNSHNTSRNISRRVVGIGLSAMLAGGSLVGVAMSQGKSCCERAVHTGGMYFDLGAGYVKNFGDVYTNLDMNYADFVGESRSVSGVVSCDFAGASMAVSGDVAVLGVDAPLNITAKSALLMEANSGRVLFSKEGDKKMPIASMVKITTLAVIYDAIANGEITPEDMVLVSPEASGMGGSQAFLDAGSEYKAEDLIKSIIIASANDSCVAMAERIAGSESAFVDRMNALAEKLGMTNTNYANVTGLPAPNAFSTANDVAKVYAYMMQSPHYGTHELDWMYDLVHPGGRITGLTNTNKHARFFKGTTGGKTGFTAEAGHCITVTATRNDLKPIAVIIGASDSKTRFAESASLMNYVFDHYKNEKIVSADEVVVTVKVKGAMQDKVDLFARNDFFDLVKKGDKSNPAATIKVEKKINAPLNAGDAQGKIIVTRGGKMVAEVDLVTNKDVKKLGFGGAVKKIVSKYKFIK